MPDPIVHTSLLKPRFRDFLILFSDLFWKKGFYFKATLI